ncbi:MAG: secondary thiamine-phosphate synthase enzyme YjbQ [Clostridia bacterium]|nr:secondary thiamine-phosphate synthase enzyme YjbQ [Clostridia bacterium]
MFEYQIKSNRSEELIDITYLINKALKQSGVKNGCAMVFCPHTTAGITINENADPDVCRDMIAGLEKIFPKDGDYRHFEGNSHAHLKSSCMGAEKTIIVHDGRLLLGTWQGVYFCEFDGPRNRKVYIKIIEEK